MLGFLWTLLGRLFVGLLAVGAILFVLVVDDTPRLPGLPAPSPEDVLAGREFVQRVRAATRSTTSDLATVSITIKEANSVGRLVARFLHGSRAVARVKDGRVVGEASLRLPWPLTDGWINAAAVVPPFEPQLRLEEIHAGQLSLPPAMSLEVARLSANLLLGDGAGDRILRRMSAMRIDGDELTFTLSLERERQGSFIRQFFGTIRGREMPEAEKVDRYYVMIRQAIETEELKDQGSFLPYLKFAFKAALDAGRGGDLPNEYTAAMFALAKACGAQDFNLIVGQLAGREADQLGRWQKTCDDVSFNNRIDSRRHFITAAALRAASNRSLAITGGEFKELLDTISGAGGFDFTDIAANNSGIRMSDLMMAQSAAAWPALLARLERANDVIIPFDSIPGLTPRREFEARYGNVGSTAYDEMLQKFEGKIDRLALHQ